MSPSACHPSSTGPVMSEYGRPSLFGAYFGCVARVVVGHRAVERVGVRPATRGLVHGELEIVGTDAVAVGVAVRERPAEQHLVGREPDAGYECGRLERGLLDLGEEVLGVPVRASSCRP